MTGLKNAFMLTDDVSSAERSLAIGSASVTVATRVPQAFSHVNGVTAYKLIENASDVTGDKLYLPSLTVDKTVDAVIEHVLGKGASLITAAAYSLDEIGAIEARFHLTPVQLLHKLGLLENTTIVGGVYLDRDDVDLMRQENARLVLCPTCAMGYGYGIAHLRALLGKIPLAVGSGDNAFNASGNMLEELKALYLSACADMRQSGVVSMDELFSLVTDERVDDLKNRLFG